MREGNRCQSWQQLSKLATAVKAINSLLNHTYQTKPFEVKNLTLIFFFYAQYLSQLDMKCQE